MGVDVNNVILLATSLEYCSQIVALWYSSHLSFYAEDIYILNNVGSSTYSNTKSRVKKREFFRTEEEKLSFFPALREHCVLLQWNWLAWRIVHRSHPEDCLCWANTNACSVRDTSFWVKDKCFTSLPSFHWLYSQDIWTESCTNLNTEGTANTVLFANIRNYCDWHLIH